MTKRIVVFRFDRNPIICRQRIAALRQHNPGVPIVGLYGGAAGPRQGIFRRGRGLLGLDAFYTSPHPGMWNWKNGDLALAAWYADEGHRWDFDVAHFVEWDLLLAAPLDEVYREVPTNAVGVTCLTPLEHVGHEWRWLRDVDERAEYQKLLDALVPGDTDCDRWAGRFACLGVGPVFPREFLAEYGRAAPPVLAHDELRIPLFAQLLGFPLADTGFRRSWMDPAEDEVFNATGRSIDPARIDQELSLPAGRRAFHPVRTFLKGVG